jgi:hypothetical protein
MRPVMQMPNYIKTTFLLLLLVAIGVAQTRNDFRSKYNDPVYDIRPNVWMSAKFAEDGQTCEVVIKEQNNCRVGAILLRSETGIKELLDDLAPESQRGKLINHSELAAGCCIGFTDEYTNVTVNLNEQAQPSGGISYSVLSIRWKQRKCKVE